MVRHRRGRTTALRRVPTLRLAVTTPVRSRYSHLEILFQQWCSCMPSTGWHALHMHASGLFREIKTGAIRAAVLWRGQVLRGVHAGWTENQPQVWEWCTKCMRFQAGGVQFSCSACFMDIT